MVYPSLTAFLNGLQQNCLLLARHGETDWNALGLIHGQQDRPLSPKGFQQRKKLFFHLQTVPLAKIYCSGLQRTLQTVQPLSEEKEIPIIILPELNEAKLGVFEGEHKVNFSDEQSRIMYQTFLQDEINVTLPGGGENLKAVHARVQKPLQEILQSVGHDGHVLVVGHRNVNKMLVQSLLGLDFEAGYRVEHRNHWLYIFAPQSNAIYLMKIQSPAGEVEISSGYDEID
jgi:broad specificity phosphatase PhoE